MVVLVASLPFVRPNILGESLSLLGFAGFAVAAVLAVAGTEGGLRRRLGPDRGAIPIAIVLGCVTAGYVWLLIQAAGVVPGRTFQYPLQGLVLTCAALGALAIVCQDPRRRRMVGRAVVLLLVLLSASWAVTFLVWLVAGPGSAAIGAIPIRGYPEPLYFPFTPSQSSYAVLGTVYPRFTGLGREPGWMAMYCAMAYFMTDMVGLRSRWFKIALLLGLVGTLSTAGFGVFLVVWAYHRFLRARGGISLRNYLRQLGGLAVVGLAAWAALEAPVFGVATKSTQNATSLGERQLATEAGIRALTETPLGAPPTEAQSGINLISDISVDGLPFVLLITAALLVPVVVMWRHRGAYGDAPIYVVFLTLLLSQPPLDSTWAFGMVLLVWELRRADPAPPERPLLPVPPIRRPAARSRFLREDLRERS
ncbi:hypothetical protein [Pseudonocardia ailaonensis]|uniref:hypothetical protein n=1 Tax=Pseudonocardia ailaonensis TaxID=367279 RepID=UPI0031DC03F1